VQLLDGTPFERLLSASQVAVRLAPEGEATRVELELRQAWRGVARLGALLGRAAGAPAPGRGARRPGGGALTAPGGQPPAGAPIGPAEHDGPRGRALRVAIGRP
jgi:hypothetical protein